MSKKKKKVITHADVQFFAQNQKEQKNRHHARRYPIFHPKTSKEQKKGHYARRLSLTRISPLLSAFVCGGRGPSGSRNENQGSSIQIVLPIMLWHYT